MKYKFCSNCGRKIPKGTQFCPHCGAKQSIGHIQHHTHSNLNFDRENNNQFKNSLHGITNFLSNHIYHIPTADFSHSRLRARKIVSIIYIILAVITVIPLFSGLFTTKADIGTVIFSFLVTIIEVLLCYLIIRWLFNVDWKHFWKTWSIKKVIIIAIALICVSGIAYSTHDDTSKDQISEFKQSAGHNQWRIGVGEYDSNKGTLQTDSTGDTYSINNGTITDNSDNNQANYHLDGNTITLSNLNNAVSGMNVPYNQLVNNSNNNQSTKATASNNMELITMAKKMFKQPSTDDVIVFKADSGQGISSNTLIVFIKA